ncbi:MAG: hydrogenase maturation nickel metallochaperone HypA [Acidobacteriota bacterium]|nr:hydrogenase maturation nickel metallochaperone HypA [Acidobacteriota bacterium]
MHELSIAQGIWDIARQHLPEGERIQAVKVEVGLLSGVVPESLEFCFEMVVSDTPAKGAQLIIDRIPIHAGCRDCGADFQVEGATFLCPSCRSPNTRVTAGADLRVVEIELADTKGKAS